MNYSKKIMRKRAHTIRRCIDEPFGMKAEFIDKALMNAVIPRHIDALETEAVCLLDIASNPQKDLDWFASQSAYEFYAKEAFARSVTWFAGGHHMSTCETFSFFLDIFLSSAFDDEVSILNDSEKKIIDATLAQLQAIDSNCGDSFWGLRDIVSKVLTHWESMWDKDISYDVIILFVKKEKLCSAVDPLTAVLLLRDMEAEYISSLIP